MNTRWLAAGALALLLTTGGMTLPTAARAQDPAPGGGQEENSAEIQNRPVKLDLESADLYHALKLLFGQVKADFTLDPKLRGTLVTVKLNQPFRIALESLLKASGLPLTYQFENGVYSVIPIKEEAVITTVEEDRNPEELLPRDRIARIRINNLSAMDIVGLLGGKGITFTSGFAFIGFNPFGAQPGIGGQGGPNGPNGQNGIGQNGFGQNGFGSSNPGGFGSSGSGFGSPYNGQNNGGRFGGR